MQKEKKEVGVSPEALKKVTPLTKDEQAGFLVFQLNDAIIGRLKNEMTYRIMSHHYEKAKGHKEREQSALAGMNKAKSFLDSDDREIKLLRALIKEVESGEFKI